MDRATFMSLAPYDRHRRMLEDYAKYYGRGKSHNQAPALLQSDADALKSSFRFIRTEEDDAEGTWEQRIARKYYNKLFKARQEAGANEHSWEYAICDLTRYKEQKIGLRWRVEKEVVVGKGQFSCASRKCENKDDLVSYEVNFAYEEAGEEKNALVKVRVCPECAYKLNYGRSSQLPKAEAKITKREREKRRREAEGLDGDAAEERRRKRREAAARDEGGTGSGGEGEGGEGDGGRRRGSDSGGEEGAAAGGGGGGAQDGEPPVDEAAFWRGERKVEKSPTREEEHDAYFAGLFL